ncbi:hypothetical protein ACIRJM_13720 [Streptomyces sp. NPDC102405]|uniref:hypothetical protein n=1 Tax=Streptomyces sp. NPDC102405 TaxID=3366170 RepID=UPI0037F7018C
MDPGVASVWAAAIAVVGTVLGGVIGAVAGRSAGKAQAKGVLEGIERQLTGERDFALWSARREALAAFLSTIEHLRVTFNHMVGLAEAHYFENRNNATEAQAAREALEQQHKDLRLKLATLRLSVPSSDADEAEVLTELAGSLITGYDDFVDSLSGGSDFDSNALFRSEVELKERIAAWAQSAGNQVQAGPARAARPQIL